MLRLRLALLLLASLVVCGCTYAGKSDEEIVGELYQLTPIGTPAMSVKEIADREFGLSGLLSAASFTNEAWVRTGWLPGSTAPENEQFAYVYELGSYPSGYLIFSTNVYGSWYFDASHMLTHIEIIREIDAL